jgi:hypothetical protein
MKSELDLCAWKQGKVPVSCKYSFWKKVRNLLTCWVSVKFSRKTLHHDRGWLVSYVLEWEIIMILTWSDLLILTTDSYVQFSITSSFTHVLSELKWICQTIHCMCIPVCSCFIASIKAIVIWGYVFCLHLIFRYQLGWNKVKYIQHTLAADRCCLTLLLRSCIIYQVGIVMSKKITALWFVTLCSLVYE